MKLFQFSLILLLTCVNLVFSSIIQFQEEDESCEEVDPFAAGFVREIGVCSIGGGLVATKLEIRVLENDANPLITICHNTNNDETLWASHTLIPTNFAEGATTGFREDQYYRTIDACKSYTKKNQSDSARLLIGPNNAARFFPYNISGQGEYYLARGHLVPRADFGVQAQRESTYFFINASPQWHVNNNGNWKTLEDRVRNLTSQGAVLRVWTGTYGRLRLPNETNNNPTEIWLGRNWLTNAHDTTKLPVPSYLWKIIVHNNDQVAVVMENNPHPEVRGWLEPMCDPAGARCGTGDWTWVNWDNRQNVAKGFIHCCTVAELRGIIPHIPDLGI